MNAIAIDACTHKGDDYTTLITKKDGPHVDFYAPAHKVFGSLDYTNFGTYITKSSAHVATDEEAFTEGKVYQLPEEKMEALCEGAWGFSILNAQKDELRVQYGFLETEQEIGSVLEQLGHYIPMLSGEEDVPVEDPVSTKLYQSDNDYLTYHSEKTDLVVQIQVEVAMISFDGPSLHDVVGIKVAPLTEQRKKWLEEDEQTEYELPKALVDKLEAALEKAKPYCLEEEELNTHNNLARLQQKVGDAAEHVFRQVVFSST